VFENHDTVLFQIQEMLRTERITAEPQIMHEVETYNELVPEKSELSLTLFIEYSEKDERERMLQALAGVEECFELAVGEGAYPVTMLERGERTDRTTAVHYGKIRLDDAGRAALTGGEAPVVFRVRHDAYRAEVPLIGATRQSLADDLV
jgi:hypothetical protein